MGFRPSEAFQTSRAPISSDDSLDQNSRSHVTASADRLDDHADFRRRFPRRWRLRRGSMTLVFDDPVVPVTKDPEGVARAGNKIRLLKLSGSVTAAKMVDDAVDSAIGATKAVSI
jgi:hypothetical protein